uniref:penicillin-binding protein 1A n=1 Tax=Crenothrix polyspora TaxID=360316 RepID=UPI00211ACE3B|nr:penicillin-binding protein 1A [Crenothrix polyspora]
MAIKLLSGNTFKSIAKLLIAVVFLAGIAGYQFYMRLLNDLPDTSTLQNVEYQTPLNIYSKEKLLIAQFGGNKRIPLTIEEVPKQLINAFLASEDDNFYEHPGVDYKGLVRAVLQLALTGKKSQGGSTITMQVTRNFFLSNEKTYTRKLKEIILALKLEREYPKDKILELYLNQIYMGHSAYGVAAATQTYYGKPLNKLSLAEHAMIAGLPKAPSAYNPITNEKRAIIRRNYVLHRMLELKMVTVDQYKEAIKQPSTAKLQYTSSEVSAPFVAEMVRQQLFEQYGERAYTSGMNVYTTISASLQKTANQALQHTLHSYDERHGYKLSPPSAADKNTKFADLPVVGDTYPATIVNLSTQKAIARLQNDTSIDVAWKNSRSAHTLRKNLKVGDIIRVRKLKNDNWALTQIPKVQGAFVALAPEDGAILALVGGFDFTRNKYNRATQSKRQPGSGFKPVIYTAALEHGYSPASTINDAPIVVHDPSRENDWRPENYTKRFYGMTSIRKAITYSRNIVSIRLLKEMGIDVGIKTGLRFGFTKDQLPRGLSLALGSGHASPLQMARFFATFANGGFLVDPYFIEHIESSDGKVIFKAKPKTPCPTCSDKKKSKPTQAPRVISPQINFLMNSMLRDVVQKGTATDAKVLGRSDLAGKTGTTNDQRDAWFNGFTPSIAASAWVGFDNFAPLGKLETGGVAALPMWVEFMRTALKGTPVLPFIPPKGIIQKGGEFFQSDYSPKLMAQAGTSSQEKSGKSGKSAKKTTSARKKSTSSAPRSSTNKASAAKPVVESLF